MASSSSSNVPAAKPPPLSYAERARRAGASSASQTTSRARPTGPNGKTRSGDESTSPASSSRNLTPNSSAALTLPGSPPPSSSQTSIDEQQAFPPMPKSPAKPPAQNVWTARKEQMARAAVHQQGHASASVQTESNAQQTSAATNRAPVNGTNVPLQQHDSMSGEHDPFVVRFPPHGHAQGRANILSTSRTPSSLDDDENWPEMGKSGPSASTSVSGSVVDVDKKDTPSKKEHRALMRLVSAEKPKWVQIPPAELQAAHDALAAQSAANSRAQSQHRRNNQAKSRSRQQSQARPSHNQSQNQTRSQNQNQNYVASLNTGPSAGPKPGETSATQSRTESTSHSRTTSVHSSPRIIPPRGRRLPEEHPFAVNTATNISARSSSVSKKLTNGIPVSEEQAPVSQPSENQNISTAHHAYQDDNPAFPSVPQSFSGPHSQSQTPYSHSPVYYPPPPNSGPQGFGYGPIPPSGGYGVPHPVPSPGSVGASMQQQGFYGYTPYGIPQFPSGQPPFPYMYQPVFPYYSASLPDQQPETHQQQQQERTQQGDNTASIPLSPVLPPASTVTRPLPPQESGPLSGYRAIAPVSVSPLLSGSAPHQSMSEVVEMGSDMVFGSVGQPGGLKSPSPEPTALAIGGDEQKNKKTPTAFAVGFEGSATIRVKRSASGKDGADDVADAIRIIDLTDKSSKWEFGTSSRPEAEQLSTDSGEQGAESYERARSVQQQTDPHILQPQPHHMMHYPPPNAPSAFQVGGYNMVPPVHLHLPSIPIPSQSPQSGAQPHPSHLPSLAPLPLNPGFVSPLALASPGPGPQSSGPVTVSMPGMSAGDEFEVRDFGYGFGPLSGSGYYPERLERYERENYRDLRDNFREPRDFNAPGGGGGFGPGRMRRSSTSGGYGSSYFEGGRGGFGGRRGRGQNGFGRGFSRGGFAGRGGHGSFQRHQPSLSVSTGPFQHQQNIPQQQPQASPDMSNPNGYFVSPTTTTSQYLSSPYGQFNPSFPPPPAQAQTQVQSQSSTQRQSHSLQHSQAPPVPVPVTALSFPLDPTRLYLLGQLEYYFSVQNLVSDFFLRKQMDSRGWIPVNLIASFNRVRQLTQDPQLVKEVLGISSLVEVRGDHVRLGNRQWVNFVLPGASESAVEADEAGITQPVSGEEAEKENDEGEEDDVVFILGGDESRPWPATG